MRIIRCMLALAPLFLVLLAACDLFQTAEKTTASQTPVMTARETATPIGTEQLFFGEVSGFNPPPVGGGDSIVAARAEPAKDEDGVRAQEAKPTIVSRYRGPWSLEERIVEADTIARARLRSAYVGAAYSHEQGDEDHYRPVVEFIYEVSEYLKGSGSYQIAVAAGFFGNPTGVSRTSMLDLALSTAERMTNHMSKDVEGDLDCDEPSFESIRRSGRCLQVWQIGDNILYGEEWLIFLAREMPYPSLVPSASGARRSEFTFIGEGRHGSLYRVAWMPSIASFSVDDALSDEKHFTTGPYAGDPSQSTFALSDVRKSIAEIAAFLESGEEMPGYKFCLSWIFYEKRVTDWDTKHYGRTYTAEEIAELREWIRDEGCAEAMTAVGLFDNLAK